MTDNPSRVPRTVFDGLRRTQKLDGNATDDDLYWYGPSELSKSLYILSRVSLCVGLLCMIMCTRGTACLSLYRAEGRAVILVLVGYNLKSLYSITKSSFPSKPFRSVLDGLKSTPLASCPSSKPWASHGPLQKSTQ